MLAPATVWRAPSSPDALRSQPRSPSVSSLCILSPPLAYIRGMFCGIRSSHFDSTRPSIPDSNLANSARRFAFALPLSKLCTCTNSRAFRPLVHHSDNTVPHGRTGSVAPNAYISYPPGPVLLPGLVHVHFTYPRLSVQIPSQTPPPPMSIAACAQSIACVSRSSSSSTHCASLS